MTFNPMANPNPVEQSFKVPEANTANPGSSGASSAKSSNSGGLGAGTASERGIDIVENGSLAAVDVVEALKDVIDPELGINIVDLGLLYGVIIDENDAVKLDMTLTSAACPLTDVIERQAQVVLSSLAAQVEIRWVWLPPWGPDCITEDGREQLRALGFNV